MKLIITFSCMDRMGWPAASRRTRRWRTLKMAPLTRSTTAPLASVTVKSPSERLMAFLVTVRGTTYGAQNCGDTTATGAGAAAGGGAGPPP